MKFCIKYLLTNKHVYTRDTGAGMCNSNTDWSVGGGGGRTAIQLTSGIDAVVAGGGGGGGGCFSGKCSGSPFGTIG